MFKFTTTFFVIYSILSLSLSTPVQAQSLLPVAGTARVTNTGDPKPDLWKAVVENERQYNARAAVPNIRELERLNRQFPKKKGLTGKQKTWIVFGAIGFAALIFVLIKYGKDCIRSEPAGCTPTVDEPCTCLEYEKK